jgi:hypothetical protein
MSRNLIYTIRYRYNPGKRKQEASHMSFQPGHKKHGGRRRGTPNRLTGEARDVARRLLGDEEYQRSLQQRLIRGEAPRIELHLWELAFARPRGEPAEAAEAAGASAGLAQILTKLGESEVQNFSSHSPASSGSDEGDTEDET